MNEEQLKEAIQYNLDYLEDNIDFELEYKELAESYSNLYEKLQQKEKDFYKREDFLTNNIKRLEQKVLKKENIIKEVREWSKKLKYETLWQTTREELEEILDKLDKENI